MCKKVTDDTSGYPNDRAQVLEGIGEWTSENVEAEFKGFLEARELGFGQVLLPFRIALTGEGGGPSMFDFAAFLGKEETLARLAQGIEAVEGIRAAGE